MASAALNFDTYRPQCMKIDGYYIRTRRGIKFCDFCLKMGFDLQRVMCCCACMKCTRNPDVLPRNIAMRKILDEFLSTNPDEEKSVLFCTYCSHDPVPTVAFCTLCEASLCHDHLRTHSKEQKHVLLDLTGALENNKCNIQLKMLKSFNPKGDSCICVYCCGIKCHSSLEKESVGEIPERMKKKMRKALEKVMVEKEETEKGAQDKATGATALFRGLRRQMEDLKEKVVSDISRQVERVSLSYQDMIRQMEEKAEQTRKMRQAQEKHNTTGPHTGDFCEAEDGYNEHRQGADGGDRDVAGISHTLHMGSPEAVDILLDVNTAGNHLHISDDRKTASWSIISQYHPECPERFQTRAQVLSSQKFSSGRHYWEIDVGGSKVWRVGVCYPTIDRRECEFSMIGWNDKSWCLHKGVDHAVIHCLKPIWLPDNISFDRVRISLDYDHGQVSFHALGDPIRHLHTYTTTFTEPLHAALWLGQGFVKISVGKRSQDTYDILQDNSDITGEAM